jgi:hypothetical protein
MACLPAGGRAQPLPPASAPASPSGTPSSSTGSDAMAFNATKKPPNLDELVKKIEKERETAIARIAEIDKKVNPILEETAKKTFGIEKEEYAVLKMQSESRRSASFFSRQRNLDRNDLGAILDYFDGAYAALQSGDYWYGEEERLVQEDASLFGTLQAEVLKNVQTRPDGAEILAMIEERKQLVSKLGTSQPLYRYLTERRQWWTSYPEYVESLKTDVEAASQYMGEENQGGGGGGGWGGDGGGWSGRRGGGMGRR